MCSDHTVRLVSHMGRRSSHPTVGTTPGPDVGMYMAGEGRSGYSFGTPWFPAINRTFGEVSKDPDR